MNSDASISDSRRGNVAALEIINDVTTVRLF